jgi:hypothetical protein
LPVFNTRSEPQEGSGAKELLLLHEQPAAAEQVMRKQQQVQGMHGLLRMSLLPVLLLLLLVLVLVLLVLLWRQQRCRRP